MRRLVIGLLLGAGWCFSLAASAAPAGAYSARLGWEAAVRAGDDSARWSLAWAYAEQGEWARAWRWIEGQSPGADSDRAYLKAWVAWRSGRAAAVEALLESGCAEDRCRQLRVNAYWDLSQWALAQRAASEWFRASGGADSLQYALAASLLNADWDAFDALLVAVDWRQGPEFSRSREAIRALAKLRANF